ncbi:MAG: MerR family transcriptional regulator [Myxococcota bacterium]
MRLAELSRRAGVPPTSIKFYIREGLLPAGAVHARNQASYGTQHLERLELIRALREVASLPLEAVGRVTRELDRGWQGNPFGEAMRAMHAMPAASASPEDGRARAALRAEVLELLRALPWTTDDERHLYADELAATLLQVRRYLYPDYPVANLARYAEIAWLLSEAEFALVPGGAPAPVQARGDDLAEPMRRAILGSLLFERIFNSLRRSANAMRSIHNARELEPPTATVKKAKRAKPAKRGTPRAKS